MRKIFFTVLFVLFSAVMYCQNNADRYIDNPSLALKDAQLSFNAGEYDRTIRLVQIYQSLSGKKDGGDVLSKAKQCQQLSEKARILEEQGNDAAVIQCYRSILDINPKDANAKSKVTIASYDEIGEYSLGLARVRIGNKWGAIDENNNIVVPIIYDELGNFGFYSPRQTTLTAHRDGKMVFVNTKGEEITRDDLYWGIRGIELDTPNLYYMVYKYDSPEVYVDMNGVEYPTEDEAAYGILGLPKRDNSTTGPYRIGDFYNENGNKGIVFDVDDSGYNGKIVSLMQEWLEWAPEGSKYLTINVGLYNENDGEANFRIIKGISGWQELFPAFNWCYDFGDGWYLPAANELSRINENMALINEGLKDAGYRPLRQNSYESSTEVRGEPDKVYDVGIYGSPRKPHKDIKWKSYMVAVRKFGSGMPQDSRTTINGIDYVDLGLSVLWAKYNLCAYAPEEYGQYVAWGEILPKEDYSWPTYQWSSGDNHYLTKYCTRDGYGKVDGKSILEQEDDAASFFLGSEWSIPTVEQWEELIRKCNWNLTEINGIKGYRVTSRINGNSIFLPAAGYYEDSSTKDVGGIGLYWSSSLNPGGAQLAWSLLFHTEDILMQYSNRSKGLSIRPVSK